MTSKAATEIKGWMESVAKFPMGRTVATRAVAARMTENLEWGEFASRCLVRHRSGDWGNLDAEDKASNEAALTQGERLFSSYWYQGNEADKLWVTARLRSGTGQAAQLLSGRGPPRTTQEVRRERSHRSRPLRHDASCNRSCLMTE